MKEAQLEDTGDTFGVGLRGMLMAKLRGGLDLLYSKNVNRYPESLTLTGAGTLFPTRPASARSGRCRTSPTP